MDTLNDQEVQRLRQATPGCKRLIHFNNAGSSLMSEEVSARMVQHIYDETLQGGYEAANQIASEYSEIYHDLAALLGGKASEFAITESATKAFNSFFYSIPWQPGDVALTTDWEYGGNYISMLHLAKIKGIIIHQIPIHATGELDLQVLEALLKEKPVKLISLTHIAAHNGGVVELVDAITMCKDAGVLTMVDAAQSFGQIPIDVGKLSCDVMFATGRKYLRGPRGTGFLFCNQRLLDADWLPASVDLHAGVIKNEKTFSIRDDARRFETWECSVASRLGMARAIRFLKNLGMERTTKTLTAQARKLRFALENIKEVETLDRGRQLAGIVTFRVHGVASHDIQSALKKNKINVSIAIDQQGYLDMQNRGLESIVRASLHYYNTDDEIDRFCEVLKLICKNRVHD